MKKGIVILIFLALILPILSFLVSADDRYIVTVEGSIDDNVKVLDEIKVPESRSLAQARLSPTNKRTFVVQGNLSSIPNLVYSEPDYKLQALEDDWNYQTIGLNLSELDSGFGEGVRIAVLDTGADFNLLNVESGYDFVNEDANASDDNGHGTLTTYILKRPQNDLPLINAEIYSVKVLNQDGSGYASDVIEGINWAVDNDIDIILMSFGGDSNSKFLEDVIKYANDKGVLIIAAAGNEGNQNLIYPAAYDSVISVGSVNEDKVKSSFSNYGQTLDFVAPGENIKVSDGQNEILVSGTSFSVPHLGIVASAYLSENLSLNNTGIIDKLKATALDLGSSGRDDEYGWGLVRFEGDGENKSLITGKVYLIDYIDGTKKPFKNTQIFLFASDQKISETYTDDNGEFVYLTNEEFISHIDILDNKANLLLRAEINFNSTIKKSSEVEYYIFSRNLGRDVFQMSGFVFTPGKDYPNFYFPNPKVNLSKQPVLLVHGWGNKAKSTDNDSWGNLESELKTSDFEVIRVQYWPANLSNRKNANVVRSSILSVLSVYPSDTKIHVVSHSMGGLATRGYIQDMAIGLNNEPLPYHNNIDKYVIIASPMYGTYFANIVDGITNINIPVEHPRCQEFINGELNNAPDSFGVNLNGNSEATRDLQIGSDFTWELNKNPDLKDIDYLTISGIKLLEEKYSWPFLDGQKYCLSNKWEVNDGVVSFTNSNLKHLNISLVTIDDFHSKIDENERAGKISSLFFKGNLNLSTAYTIISLDSNEIYFDPIVKKGYLYNESINKGSVVINLSKSQVSINSNSLKLRNSMGNSLQLEINPLTKRWFYSNLAHKKDEYIHFTTMLPIGTYRLIVNNFDSGYEIKIFPGQVNLVEIKLDLDGDGYDLDFAGGSDCDDSNSDKFQYLQGYTNNDGDEFGTGELIPICSGIKLPEGYSEIGGDCNDNNYNINPNALEICDGLDNDCDGLINEGDVCKTIFINSPTPNFNYSERRLNFDILVDQIVDEITYIDGSDDRPRDRTLCRNCLEYNKSKSLQDGLHNITFKAIKDDAVIDEENVTFRIDSKAPRITKTTPKGGFASGSFDIEFTEQNPSQLTLHYGNSTRDHVFDINNGCTPVGDKYTCSTDVNLSDFNGQKTNYWFELSDIAGNAVMSKPINIDVDTTKPVINSFTNLTNGRRVTLRLNVTEVNFDEITYTDSNDRTPRPKVLCSRLRGGICEATKTLSLGPHNLSIKVLDEAGNFVERNETFVII